MSFAPTVSCDAHYSLCVDNFLCISCTEMGWAPKPGIIAVNKHIKTSFCELRCFYTGHSDTHLICPSYTQTSQDGTRSYPHSNDLQVTACSCLQTCCDTVQCDSDAK